MIHTMNIISDVEKHSLPFEATGNLIAFNLFHTVPNNCTNWLLLSLSHAYIQNPNKLVTPIYKITTNNWVYNLLLGKYSQFIKLKTRLYVIYIYCI